MVVGYNIGHPGVVLDDNIYGDILVMEIILAWLWLGGIVALLVLMGYLLQGHRNNQPSHGSYCLKDRLLPDRMELFRQRRRQPHPAFQHFPRLS
jgi:hypothetical protein